MKQKIHNRATTIKWNELPIHPANNAPPMSGAEIAELAEDIKAHGMHEPIILWRDNREEANGSKGPFPLYLLDGRNRLAALKLLGIDDPYRAQYGDLTINTVVTLRAIKEVWGLSLSGSHKYRWETDCDPYAFHQSMNVYRRHLTPGQRRELIAVRLKENPARPNRQIGKVLKVDHKTVGTVRKDLERRGEIPHVDRTIDTKGRSQPTAKPKPAANSVSEEELREGRLIRDAERSEPGVVRQALDNALAAGEEPTREVVMRAVHEAVARTAPTPIDRVDSIVVHNALMNLAEVIGKVEPEVMVKSGVIFPDEVGQMLDIVGALQHWLRRFGAALNGESDAPAAAPSNGGRANG